MGWVNLSGRNWSIFIFISYSKKKKLKITLLSELRSLVAPPGWSAWRRPPPLPPPAGAGTPTTRPTSSGGTTTWRWAASTELTSFIFCQTSTKQQRVEGCVCVFTWSLNLQRWALSLFFNFFTNKKWFLASFIKLIWLGVVFLSRNGAEIGY